MTKRPQTIRPTSTPLPKRRRRPLALEPRVLFDGVALHDASAAEAHSDTHEAQESFAQHVEVAALGAPDAARSAREILFVDPAVPDLEVLLAGVRDDVLVVRLDPQQDPFEQIGNALEQNPGVGAMHLVSHGGPGFLTLGGHSITIADLDARAPALSAWRASLAEGADLLIYGCDVAAGDAGQQFVARLAAITGTDVAASRDATGGAAAGGDWQLEAAVGTIEAGSVFTAEGAAAYQARLSTISLSGNSNWVPVLSGTKFDPDNDTQSNAADTDLIGDDTHPMLYAAYDDGGTPNSTADDTMAFRLRIDNPTSPTYFGGVALIGMDANLDGKIDLFFAVDGRNNGQAVRLFDPGTSANVSPNTTSTSPLPVGWIASNGVYSFNTSNYSVNAVSAGTDPHWSGNSDLSNDGKTDVFVSFKIPFTDIATVLSKPSPANRSGVAGPRGTAGISGFTKDTMVRYVAMTQTQTGPINGDIGGVGSNYDKNASFTSLGAYSGTMSPSNPLPSITMLTVSEPVDSDGTLNASEDDATAIYVASDLADHSKTFTVTVTDSANNTVSGTASYDAVSGKWKMVADLSTLNDGTLTITATYDPDNDAATLNSVSDTATVLHDKTAPAIAIDQLASATSGTPTVSGTTDLPAGAFVTITFDADNDSATANLVYRALVVAGTGGVNTWSINTQTATPVSGTLPAGGLSSYTKISATAQDAAGNSATATALNRPTVNTQSTNSTTPTITGTWTKTAGDTLTVTVSGATYSLTPTGNSWSLNLATATPTSGSLTPLAGGNSYSVIATVARAGMTSVSDTTDSELTITNAPVAAVDITGGASASGSDTTPTISGTSANAGGFVLVRLDPNNDGNLSDAVTYSVTPDGSGNWTLDTGTATPLSGIVPVGGFTGNVGVMATNATGTVSDTQTLTISTPSVTVGSITSTATTDGFGVVSNTGGGASWLNVTEDNAVTISGTATTGYTVNVVVSDANGNSVAASGIAVNNGTWSATGLNLSNLDNGTLTVTATLSGTAISASNTSVTHDKSAPQIFNTTQSVIEKNSGVTIKGTSELLNTPLTVSLYSDAGYTTALASYTPTTSATTGEWSTTTNVSLGNINTVYIRVRPTSTTTDSAGNIVQVVDSSRAVSQSSGNSDKTINVKAVTGDNQIDVSEIGSGITISGETNVTSSTVTVTITDGTTTLTKTATSGSTYSAGTNNWSVSLTKAEVQSLKNGQIQVTGSVVDTSKTVSVTDVELATLSLPTPLITITDNIPGTAAGDVTFTFTFSEDMVAEGTDAAKSFTASDITVTNGTKGTFTKIGPSVYTLVVTPTAGSTGSVTVSIAGAEAYGINSGRGNAAATGSQAYNTTDPTAGTPPALTIDASALDADSTPLITGTTSLPAGTPIVVTIDPDNDASTNNSLTYSATVQSGGGWSLDLGTATPTSGTLPSSGLYTWAKITATGTNAFGYSTTVTALDRPNVNRLTTNDTTPTLTGTWTNIAGDALSVTVGGTTYTTSNGLVVSGNTWSLTTAALTAGTKEVQATTTRGASSVTDSSSNELVIDTTAPTVAITSPSTTRDTTPVISGTTDLPAGSSMSITIDPDNDPGTNNSVSYIVIVKDGGGTNTWSVDTGSATPSAGSFPSGGLAGTVGVTATGTDTAGNTTSASQTLNVDIIPPVISITSNAKTPSTTPVITGTTDLAAGSTITLVIDPDNVAGGPTYTYTATVQAGGSWSVDTASAIPAESAGAVTYTSGNTLGLSATATDSVGNSGTANKAVQITTAPTVTVATPIDGESGQNGDGTLTASEDNGVVIKGSTTAPAGSRLTVTLTDGTITISDTATVANDGTWQLDALNLSGMANGVIAVTATYIDGSGDSYSGSASVLHDKASGGGVSIDSITSDTGVLADFITSDATLLFKGSASANASVTVTLRNAASAQVFSTTVTADSGGNWSYDYQATSLASGSYTLTASSGGPTASQAIVIDASAPAGPVTVTTLNTSDTTPAITGTATVAAGETFQVTVNGKTYTSGDGNLALSGNNWTLNIPPADVLPIGTYEVTATISDVAGNILSDTTNNELAIASDSTAPAAPSVDLLATSDSGTSDADDKTSDTTPTIRVSLNGSGAAAPVAGDVVKLYE
ncbi:MAG TPA: DUF4347 domain-containing protein, partial [Noviherbaspirillum sp.]|uniref:DUF4347 domain-containing protein n=1 Tax=Noviherbaspirillum sp. TaxID=1926288 RepID=UPI002D6D1F38